MKKKWTALLVLAMVFVLGACGGKKEVTKTLRNTKTPGVTLEITYYAKGDRVVKQTANNTIIYKESGMDKAALEQKLAPVIEKYKNLSGITHSMEYGETEAHEKIEIIFDQVEFEKVKDVEGIGISADPKKTPISLSKSVEMLKKLGWKEVDENNEASSAAEQSESSSGK